MNETVPPPSSNPITATVPWQDPQATKALASAPKKRRTSTKRWLVVGLLIAILAGLGVWDWQATRGPEKVAECKDTEGTEKPPPQIDLAKNENLLGMKFVKLSKGTFYMGSDGTNKGKRTEIKEDFEIAIHPVTQRQWQALMGKNPSYFSRVGEGKDKVADITDEDLKQFPVERVSWNECRTSSRS